MSLLESTVKLLVNGCSFSRGPTAWPYHIPGVDLTNLACAGAGNSYIFNSTMSELAQRSYDFVAIMWTQPARLDVKVSDIDQFQDTAYNSRYQSSRNDWAEKIVYPENDQDRVEKDWVFGCGFLNSDPALLKTKLFDQLYRHQGDPQFVYHTLIMMISLQNTLKQRQIPYLFMYFRDYESELKQIQHLYQQLDQDHIYNQENIYAITQANGWYDPDGLHPGIQAHQQWAQLITPRIKC